MMDDGILNINGFTAEDFTKYMSARGLYALSVLPTVQASSQKPGYYAPAIEKVKYIARTMFELGFNDGLKHYKKMAMETYCADCDEIESKESKKALVLAEIKYACEKMSLKELNNTFDYMCSLSSK